MTTYNVTVYLKYTAPANDQRPNIEYFSDADCTQPWVAPAVRAGDATKYTIQAGQVGSKFDFNAVTFWAKDAEQKLASQVARTFQEKVDGNSAKFGRKEFITEINASKKTSISFTITNLNDSGESGFVSFQTTIRDRKTKDLLTSVDPQIPLPLPDIG